VIFGRQPSHSLVVLCSRLMAFSSGWCTWPTWSSFETMQTILPVTLPNRQSCRREGGLLSRRRDSVSTTEHTRCYSIIEVLAYYGRLRRRRHNRRYEDGFFQASFLLFFDIYRYIALAVFYEVSEYGMFIGTPEPRLAHTLP